MGSQERRHTEKMSGSEGILMKLKSFIMSDFDIEPISDNLLHGPVTPDVIKYLNERNKEKRQQSIEFLGSKWLLHPENMKRKQA